MTEDLIFDAKVLAMLSERFHGGAEEAMGRA